MHFAALSSILYWLHIDGGNYDVKGKVFYRYRFYAVSGIFPRFIVSLTRDPGWVVQ